MTGAIVFEGTRDGRVLSKLHTGRGWNIIPRRVADAMLESKVAHGWPSRHMAEDYLFIPPSLKPTKNQRQRCQHDFIWITNIRAYKKQWSAGWCWRCRCCGGYAR